MAALWRVLQMIRGLVTAVYGVALGVVGLSALTASVAMPGNPMATDHRGMAIASHHRGAATEGSGGWDLRRLHPEVRRRVHLRASQVPPFPHDDPALMDPKRWPRELRIQGRRCVLRVEAVVEGRSAMFPRTLESLDPKRPFTLYYAPHGSSEQLGPVYFWGRAGQLVDRRWIEVRDGYRITHEYGYHSSGRLSRHAVGRDRVIPPASGGRSVRDGDGIRAERFSEFFDEKGRLRGLGYSRVLLDETTFEVYYKDGKRISYPAFERDAEAPDHVKP